MAHYVLYLPGFGDHRNSGIQIKLFNQWRKFGLIPRFHKIGWNNNEPFESKFDRILKTVDALIEQKHTISLVGVSAGATMALNVYSARKQKINKVVFICGKIARPEKVSDIYFRRNPAFKKSLEFSSKNLQQLTGEDKAKMLSIHPSFDETVYVKDTILEGATNKTIFSLFHAPSIILAISLYKRIAIKFIKNTK